jgi:ActR/RegA family two-component response regulator
MQYRILVVDDDHEFNDQICRRFLIERHLVQPAYTYEEALEYLAASRSVHYYDLVILDVILGEGLKSPKGNDVLKWIKQHKIHTRVIIYTGICKDRSHIVQYCKDGVCNYLIKGDDDLNTLYDTAIKAISLEQTINVAIIDNIPGIIEDLIKQYEIMMRETSYKKTELPTQTFNIITTGSQYIDNSINIQDFSQVHDFIEKNIQDDKKRQELIKQLKELDSTQKTPEFLLHYQKFIASLADHITLFLPVLQFLAQNFPK